MPARRVMSTDTRTDPSAMSPTTPPPPRRPRLQRDVYRIDNAHHEASWFYTCRGSRLADPQRRADPFWIICLRSMLRNIDKLTQTHIRAIPPRLLHKMWERVKAAELASVAVWILFEPVSHVHGVVPPVIKKQIILDEEAWGDGGGVGTYLRRLSSPMGDWLVRLTLSGIRCSAADLKSVAEMPNLQALSISNVVGFDDRSVRAWGRLASGSDEPMGSKIGSVTGSSTASDLSPTLLPASSTKPSTKYFPNLSMLGIYIQTGITKEVVTFLSDFPHLTHVLIWRAGLDFRPTKWDDPLAKVHAIAQGWHSRTVSMYDIQKTEEALNSAYGGNKGAPTMAFELASMGQASGNGEGFEYTTEAILYTRIPGMNANIIKANKGGQSSGLDVKEDAQARRQITSRHRKRLRASLAESIGTP